MNGWMLFYGYNIINIESFGYMIDNIFKSLLSETREFIDFYIYLIEGSYFFSGIKKSRISDFYNMFKKSENFFWIL